MIRLAWLWAQTISIAGNKYQTSWGANCNMRQLKNKINQEMERHASSSVRFHEAVIMECHALNFTHVFKSISGADIAARRTVVQYKIVATWL
eukprot:1148920-Pelagomonas_calceolata.AAC.3